MSDIGIYAEFTSTYMLSWCDLYSGGENDSIIDATVNAMDNLAFDNEGKCLPFSLETSIFTQDFDRASMLLEDVPKTHRRRNQKIEIKVIVFKNMDDYISYELNKEILTK